MLSKKLYILLFSLAALVYILGLTLIHIFDIDAAQYASIAMEMMQSGSYLEVFHRGNDYLDKPPLVFWLGAISYDIFGISHWAYRLPSFFASILGIYATYGLAKRLYNQHVGQLSALILATTHVYFLHNHDVRTDTLLTNFVIFGIWQTYAYLQDKKFIQLFLGFSGFALAMLAKGPIGLMVPVLSLGAHFLYKRQFKNFIKPEWLIGLVIIAFWLAPMVYGLYTQFDLQPEKTVNGVTGESGVKFYFWTQSFGRLTGENVWSNDSGFDFFWHTFLWEFMPWMMLAYFSVIRKLFLLVKTKFNKDTLPEVITLAGFLLAMIALSKSHYKLPHYIMVIFPHAAILTAHQIYEIFTEKETWFKPFYIIQTIIVFLLMALFAVINLWFFPMPWYWLFFAVVLFGTAIYFAFSKDKKVKFIVPSALAIIAFNLGMNLNFYPSLNQYHTGAVAGTILREKMKIPKDHIYGYKVQHHSFDVYSHQIAPIIYNLEATKDFKGDYYFYTNEEGKNELMRLKHSLVIDELPNYHVLILNGKFLNPATRDEVTKPYYIVKVLF